MLEYLNKGYDFYSTTAEVYLRRQSMDASYAVSVAVTPGGETSTSHPQGTQRAEARGVHGNKNHNTSLLRHAAHNPFQILFRFRKEDLPAHSEGEELKCTYFSSSLC